MKRRKFLALFAVLPALGTTAFALVRRRFRQRDLLAKQQAIMEAYGGTGRFFKPCAFLTWDYRPNGMSWQCHKFSLLGHIESAGRHLVNNGGSLKDAHLVVSPAIASILVCLPHFHPYPGKEKVTIRDEKILLGFLEFPEEWPAPYRLHRRDVVLDPKTAAWCGYLTEAKMYDHPESARSVHLRIINAPA